MVVGVTELTRLPWSMELSRQEYWSGQPFPSADYLPNPGIESKSPALEADSLLSEPPGKPVIKKVKMFIDGELQIQRRSSRQVQWAGGGKSQTHTAIDPPPHPITLPLQRC